MVYCDSVMIMEFLPYLIRGEYRKITDGKKLKFQYTDPNWPGEIIVFRGRASCGFTTYIEKLKPFLEMLNNILNASNTCY